MYAPLPLTLRQLQYVVAIAETGSFRAAAERCRVAQPSLSAQVAALEDALGAPLFERGPRRVRTTPAGEAVVSRGRDLLRAATDLADVAVRHADPLAGPLRLGIIPTVAPYLLPALTAAIQRSRPATQPRWREDRTATLVQLVDDGELDAIVLADDPALVHLARLPLSEDPFVLCLPRGHRLAARTGPVELSEVADTPFLLLDEGHCLRDQALAWCGRTGARESDFRATSLQTLVQMVAGGAGLTLLPRMAVQTEGRRGDVALLDIGAPTPGRSIVLAWRRGSVVAPAMPVLAAVFQGGMGDGPSPIGHE